MNQPWILAFIGMGATIFASQGFWLWVQKRDTTRNALTKLVLGLAHDRIIFLGQKYIDQGYITKDEYEDLLKYLWVPYSQFGGNGLAERIMVDVSKLPLRGSSQNIIPIQEERYEQQHRHRSGRGEPMVEQRGL